MTQHVFTGFGFGPIQAGLFVSEAFTSGNFSRIVIAEIDQPLVDAVRANKGSYTINVACADHIDCVQVNNIDILNPLVTADRSTLLDALAQSTEIATSLPAVSFYTAGAHSAASLIAAALARSVAPAALIYAAENNNHAAELLSQDVTAAAPDAPAVPTQFLNTVIGKMSGVITDPAEIARLHLQPIAPGLDRAFLVEQFNKILVSRCTLDHFAPGIDVFIEKDELLPFEEAKLYGHNAIHALLAYLGSLKGYARMTELADDHALMTIGRDAFLNESGAALISKYSHLGDELFTPAGFTVYAEDLLARMTNPFLTDTTARAGRDPVRKLGLHDRIFGTMSLALSQNIAPRNMALGAVAGLAALLADTRQYELPADLCLANWRDLDDSHIAKLLQWLWQDNADQYHAQLIKLTQAALPKLLSMIV